MTLSKLILVMVAIATGWLMIQAARWTAPLSAAAGFIILVIGVYSHSLRAMGFGVGLFVFSAILFAKGGGDC